MVNEETLYARYISGELTPEEIKQIEQNGDRKKLDKIIQTVDNFKLPPVDKASGFQKLKNKKKATTKDNVRSLPIARWVTGIAAAALLAVGIYLFTRSDVIDLNATYANILEHQFSDDSRVVINAGSTISYDRLAWNRKRSVKLEGEAYFDVEKGAPFTVHTELGTVEVLGTEFNVRAHGDNLTIECYEGRVRVRSNDIDQILNAQQGINLRNTTTSELFTVTGKTSSWQRGRSSFRETTLGEVFRELERQYDVQVISDLSDMPFRGTFDNNDLDKAVNEIAKPLGIEADISPDRKQVTFSQ